MSHKPSLEVLLVAVAQGERNALHAIYQRESRRLFGIAMFILRNRPDASDVVQNAFLKVWQRAKQYDPSKGTAQAWMGGIVRYAALDIAHARRREFLGPGMILGDTPVEPEAFRSIVAIEDSTRLQACMAKLDKQSVRFIVLAFVHGQSHVQIAEQLGLPLGSVKSRIRRGLQSLRKCLL